MKKVLGLDLGTTSIGWALVNEAENQNERSAIVKIGVRVNPLTTGEQTDFEKGASITSAATRTQARGKRRRVHRYKLRRAQLIEVLKAHRIISDEAVLSEQGNSSTFKTYKSRSDAASRQIPLEDFAKVLLMINKKRGYKSNRKAKSQDEGQLIDGMEIAKRLYDENKTPGELTHKLLEDGGKYIPDFYRSDLQAEFDRIWRFQQQFYPEILTAEHKEKINALSKKDTCGYFQKGLNIELSDIKGKEEKRRQPYVWRSEALSNKVSIKNLAYILTEIRGQIENSSGYLGSISDRSKELSFKRLTVGQYLYGQIEQSSHARLRGQVFYRKDYLDEFETIWEEQAKHHRELTNDLKGEVRDIIIFYQRKLKSQKGLISFCEFESKPFKIIKDGKEKTTTKGMRVCPRSSPLFQEFNIWQTLGNIRVIHKKSGESRELSYEKKQLLFSELSIKPKISKKEALKFLLYRPSEVDLSHKDVEGNRTIGSLFEAFKKVVEASGHNDVDDFKGMSAAKTISTIRDVFETLGIDTSILSFDSSLEGKELERQPLFSFGICSIPTKATTLQQEMRN